jgi:hypothetical protein
MDSGQRTEVLAVAELIIATPIDQIVSYDDMSAAAGCDVRQKRWIILQAKALMNREHGIVLSPKRGIGYRRLGSESGVRHAGEKAIKRTRNAAKNGRTRLKTRWAGPMILRRANCGTLTSGSPLWVSSSICHKTRLSGRFRMSRRRGRRSIWTL